MEAAPFDDIMRLLCRQASEWLDGGHAAALSSLAAKAESAESEAAIDALKALVDANLDTLWRRWRLDFAASLAADVTALDDWETTADLLQLANDKAESEKRIVVGAALLTAFGVADYASFLRQVIAHDAGLMDIDAVIAKRVLEARDPAST